MKKLVFPIFMKVTNFFSECRLFPENMVLFIIFHLFKDNHCNGFLSSLDSGRTRFLLRKKHVARKTYLKTTTLISENVSKSKTDDNFEESKNNNIHNLLPLFFQNVSKITILFFCKLFHTILELFWYLLCCWNQTLFLQNTVLYHSYMCLCHQGIISYDFGIILVAFVLLKSDTFSTLHNSLSPFHVFLSPSYHLHKKQ